MEVVEFCDAQPEHKEIVSQNTMPFPCPVHGSTRLQLGRFHSISEHCLSYICWTGWCVRLQVLGGMEVTSVGLWYAPLFSHRQHSCIYCFPCKQT